MGARYTGRFAPSPTGPLHAGSLVAALASWLDARAHGGRWLVRIEDVDTARTVPGADRQILQQLAQCGLRPDEEPVWQSRRIGLYQRSLESLIERGSAYGCACTRSDIETALSLSGRPHARHTEMIYPGTCRDGPVNKPVRAWRLRCTDTPVEWRDRRLGLQTQNVESNVGDFVLRRADGYFAYQLAVVVDDAAQSVTDIVRGEDLADNTARQILLQTALSLPVPRYLHTPLVLGADGEKLSKQNGAQALDTAAPLQALNAAASVLGLAVPSTVLSDWLQQAVQQWRQSWVHSGSPAHAR